MIQVQIRMATAVLAALTSSMVMSAQAVPAFATPNAPKPSSPAAPPPLSIAIDNGRTTVGEGDRLTYTIKLRNLGTSAARGVQVSETFPAGVRVDAADGKATKSDGRVSWLTDVAVGSTVTFTVAAVVGKTPPTMLRLASVACARAAGATKPMVCATDTDLLPAGLAQANGPQGSGFGPLWWVLAVLAAVLIGGLLLLPATRRRLATVGRSVGRRVGRQARRDLASHAAAGE